MDDRLVVTDGLKVYLVAAITNKELRCTYLGTSRFESWIARQALRGTDSGMFAISGEWKYVRQVIESMKINDTRKFVI